MNSLLHYLKTLIEDAAAPLPMVHARRMFGCDTLFADGNIFALVWKDGRLGLRLSDAALYEALMALPGAEPWAVADGHKPMSHWVLVPEAFHDDPPALAAWTARAHALAMAAPRKPKPEAKSAGKPKTPRRPKPPGGLAP